MPGGVESVAGPSVITNSLSVALSGAIASSDAAGRTPDAVLRTPESYRTRRLGDAVEASMKGRLRQGSSNHASQVTHPLFAGEMRSGTRSASRLRLADAIEPPKAVRPPRKGCVPASQAGTQARKSGLIAWFCGCGQFPWPSTVIWTSCSSKPMGSCGAGRPQLSPMTGRITNISMSRLARMGRINGPRPRPI